MHAGEREHGVVEEPTDVCRGRRRCGAGQDLRDEARAEWYDSVEKPFLHESAWAEEEKGATYSVSYNMVGGEGPTACETGHVKRDDDYTCSDQPWPRLHARVILTARDGCIMRDVDIDWLVEWEGDVARDDARVDRAVGCRDPRLGKT